MKADNPPKPWRLRSEASFIVQARRRVFYGGTTGSARGAPFGDKVEVKMEELETLLKQIKTDISNGKSDEEIFQSLLLFLEKDPQAGGKLAECIVTIPDRIIGKLLLRMLEATREKKIRKIIKRSLYRLKSKGVVMEEVFPDKERSILRPFQAESKEGFASGIDFLGQRLFGLVIPHPGRGF